MASVEDRWYREVKQADGSVEKVETDRQGKGKRWLLRWRDPDGTPRKKSFARKAGAEAEKAVIEADKLRGSYIDPQAGKETPGPYLTRWRGSQNSDPSTLEGMENRFRLYIEPHSIWRAPLNSIRPSTVQSWLRYLGDKGLAPTTIRVVFAHLSTALSAAVDDGMIAKNPCRASSVVLPKIPDRGVVPWAAEWVSGMRAELPDRYKVAVTLGVGLGLRQGEMFGLSPDDVDFLRYWVTVQRQVKFVNGRLVFALPKGQKIREVPLPPSVRDELAAYLARFPAQVVTLPWETPGAKKSVTAPLVMTNSNGEALKRPTFNQWAWSPARQRVGIPASRENGCHALRHYYASVLLDAGESIKAVSEYLGHASAGYTLKTYTHLMPTSEDRTRKAIDEAFRSMASAPDVPQGEAASV
ncbi:site-specific integrase [Saccharopolyspora sp. K220]|uniref:tyrosine-type recombinase/integrase n=1 Tax=Saccharopolyspora soli TaxID=2926618 RepID=UPI001F5A96D8|nr:tyrosine-type recombinase/integrase [Saccharopolyspora soli]MCI2422760.1 site-specific integrase [Saccharopolyspora soli]